MKYRYILVLLSLIFSLSLSAQRIMPMFKCSKRLNDPYGMCAHFTFTDKKADHKTMGQQAKMLHDLGCDIVRSDLTFGMVKDNNTGILDSVINVLQNNNLSFLGIATDPRLYAGRWTNNNEFEKLLNTLNLHYVTKVKYLELQNEVNYSRLPELWKHYTDDLKSLFLLKKRNKNFKIVFSGLGDTKYDFVDSVMSYGGYNYFDK